MSKKTHNAKASTIGSFVELMESMPTFAKKLVSSKKEESKAIYDQQQLGEGLNEDNIFENQVEKKFDSGSFWKVHNDLMRVDFSHDTNRR